MTKAFNSANNNSGGSPIFGTGGDGGLGANSLASMMVPYGAPPDPAGGMLTRFGGDFQDPTNGLFTGGGGFVLPVDPWSVTASATMGGFDPTSLAMQVDCSVM